MGFRVALFPARFFPSSDPVLRFYLLVSNSEVCGDIPHH